MQGTNDTKQKIETRALTGMLKSLSYSRRLCPHRDEHGSNRQAMAFDLAGCLRRDADQLEPKWQD